MDLRDLIHEAADAARNDFDASSALTWAQGYEFPQEYVVSDVACLRAAQLDFEAMVRRRLKVLSHDRLSPDRVARLRADNPERELMMDLAGGMRVHLPQGQQDVRSSGRAATGIFITFGVGEVTCQEPASS